MPKIVDHDERRQTLAATAVSVIAEVGIENATLRDIAQMAGFSTGIVGHYFGSKDELMLSALVWVEARVAQRFNAMRNRSIERALESILPLDKGRRDEWRVRVNFWGRAMANQDLATKLAESMDRSQQLLRVLVREECASGSFLAGLDCAVVAETLFDRTMSLSLKILFQPKAYPRHRVRQKIVECVGEFSANEPMLASATIN